MGTCGRRTEILNVLVSKKAHDATRELAASLCAGLLGLEDDNAVCEGGSKKRGAVAKDGHAAVVVHAQPREAIADGGEDEGQVAGA